ncbi:hypothetical protein [Bradyrhizobium sp. USDA 4508]
MIAATIVLVLLHAPNGHEILVNPREVTSMRAAIPDQKNEHFTDDVHCMISLTDGKFVTVVETCDTVRRLFERPKGSP